MNIENLIWSLYRKNPCKLFSIREIALELHKTYPLIHQHMKRLLAQNKFLSKKVGKSILCYPNYHHSYTVLSLALAEQENTQVASKDAQTNLIAHFFASKRLSGLLATWSSTDTFYFLISSSSYESSIQEVLSSTTLQKNICFLTSDQQEKVVDALLKKELVFFGFEQVHLLIREHYDLFASKFNVVTLHE